MRWSPPALARRVAHGLRHRFAPRALVLMYHRIAELPGDPQLLAVTPQHFDQQLAVLRQVAELMALDELTRCLRTGRLPRRAAVVTFDDGYADNLYVARPILQRHAIPATVFVTSGQIGSRQEFWWDELERLTLQPGHLPARLELDLAGLSLRWEAGAAAYYSAEDQRRHRGWDIEQPGEPGPRHVLFRRLYHALHEMAAAERDEVLTRLRAWAGASAEGRMSHRTMEAGEVASLAAGGLVEVGAHTHSHPALATLTPTDQWEEIRQGKLALERILGHPVTSFAYPHGSYNDATVTAVRGAGFSCACCSDTDAVWPDASLFQLPRLVVRNWDGPAFARWLRGWFGG